MDAMQVAQVSEMMLALQNPAGIPFFPIVFIGLGVLTFALHILFVQLLLGTSAITLFGAFSHQPYWHRLANAMVEVAKVSVSVAILIGVAPLLFVQVVYDPQWYTSNVLSANWVVGFIAILIVAYWLLYWFYYQNKASDKATGRANRSTWAMIGAIALFLTVGFIMHSLTKQMLHPELWQSWYMPDGKTLDYSGASLHAYNVPRFLFFISLSIPVTGALLVSYRRFKMVRDDADMGYLDWVGERGKQWIKIGSIIALVPYVLWMLTVPETAAGFGTSIIAILGGLMLVVFAVWAHIRLTGDNRICPYMALPMALIVGLVIAIVREVLRYQILNDVFSYNFMDYKVVMDWYSTALFFLTFAIVGGGILAYLLTVAWQVGQTKGVYTASKTVDLMGTIAIWILVIWIVQFFVVGFVVWAQ